MRRKILPLILALCLCLNLTVAAHAAGTTLQVDVPQTLPAVGETFTVTVSISGNPGLGAVQLALGFDDSVLNCTSVALGKVLNGSFSATNPDAASGAKVAAATTGKLSSDGELITCTFKVLKNGDPAFVMNEIILSTPEGTAVNATSNIASTVTPPVSQPEEPETEDETEEEEPDEEADEEPEEETEEPEEKAPVQTFRDVSATHWAHEYIEKAAAKGLIGGYSDGTFRPGKQVTRAQFLTMMWRMAGKPASSGKTPFTDIGGVSSEFRSAIAWAYENGYIGGRTATTFAPYDSLTRQAAMKVLFLYSGGRSGQELLFTKIYDDNFVDSGSLSPWAKESMYWAVYNELLSGTTPTTLGAGRTATRGQLAKILVNYSEVFGS